ncbi:xanthine dehydrogenase/oxidase-like isoform X1 [Vanessa atalanta]|uniref:xanthine dehydrogenase/oxidase-like isoform X1 n=2 Tax=Vanessa atalanta TaxID=42275 RepID=UPI001FCCF159|nr:xanthine dehydrogenase/oxidase-like isoform X1 [Vanessa atalanta]
MSSKAGMDSVKFKVNGSEYSIGGDVSSTTTLLEFLRRCLELRGTKYMCLEGGCGACIISVIKSPGSMPEAVNSCLVSVPSCHGWEVTTIEKIGNRLDGYHPLQKTLAETNGTQCGYCSPGFVMSMYNLLKSKRKTMIEIEQQLSSNICRCTGYRTILEAFKKFASDAPKPNKIMDIEDITLCNKTSEICLKNNIKDNDWCFVSGDSLGEINIEIDLKDNRKWFRVNAVEDVFNILRKEGSDSYMLVAGNTGKGVRPIVEYPRVLIDVTAISDLKGFYFDQNMVVGAGTTLTELMDIFADASDTEYFGYLKVINEHIQLVANVAIRNQGTIAGNLMIKHKYRDFSSDIFLLLQAVGAQLTIRSADGVTKTVTMENFLNENMRGKIILNVLLPPLNTAYKLVTYKVSAKSRNAHAIVNAAFLYKLNEDDNKVLKSRIVFGGLSSNFSRATKTENFIIGKMLFNNNILQQTIKILSDELVVTDLPPEPSVQYRKQLAIGLFYKGLLFLSPQNILHSRYKSGKIKLHQTRPVSTASQSFPTDPNIWPLNEPIPKVEALHQCAGEAKYVDDHPSLPREVFATFVLTTIARGNIDIIDATEALNFPGVIAFYTAKDIPGVNSFTPPEDQDSITNEEILCDGEVFYYNQPLGIIVAESYDIANRARLLVKVKYSNVRQPKIDIRNIKNDPSQVTLFSCINATDKGNDVVKVIDDDQTIFGQYHFCLENLSCVSWPTEEGIKATPTSHYLAAAQTMSARCLNIDQSRVDMEVHRVGGSFGLKLSRQTLITTACSIATYKLNRPCRFLMPLRIQTRAIGKRMPSSTNYEIGVNSEGVIQYLNYDIYDDNGYIVNELLIRITEGNYYNCYDKARWNFRCFNAISDTPSNTWFRSPGTLEAISAAETIMERIAYELDLDPLTVRLNNLDKEFGDLIEMTNTLINDSNYIERKKAKDKFNSENRWKKRGLRFALMRWNSTYPYILNITLSVYSGDGSVAITHGGVELGQGINTKAIQVCAYFLNIPVSKIKVKASNTMANPNNSCTVSSLASQNVALGVTRCCKELLERLEPLRRDMGNPTWERLIARAYELGINLQANGLATFDDVYKNNNVFGAILAEVEVDVLTGESEILRVDLLEDVGRSINPLIDIGQIEGAFVQGLGYMTSEELVYNYSTGELLTDRSWNYYVPQATDIPQDFRIYFREKSYSYDAILGTKSTSEPPLCLSVVVPFAMREAIASARLESGIPSNKWFNIDGPYTVEKICLSCETKIEDLKFY